MHCLLPDVLHDYIEQKSSCRSFAASAAEDLFKLFVEGQRFQEQRLSSSWYQDQLAQQSAMGLPSLLQA
jgi:hypothetical protein